MDWDGDCLWEVQDEKDRFLPSDLPNETLHWRVIGAVELSTRFRESTTRI